MSTVLQILIPFVQLLLRHSAKLTINYSPPKIYGKVQEALKILDFSTNRSLQNMYYEKIFLFKQKLFLKLLPLI